MKSELAKSNNVYTGCNLCFGKVEEDGSRSKKFQKYVQQDLKVSFSREVANYLQWKVLGTVGSTTY